MKREIDTERDREREKETERQREQQRCKEVVIRSTGKQVRLLMAQFKKI